MTHLRLFLPAVAAVMILALSACGGDDDPPPADIHPLETKPFDSAERMHHHDDSESKRIQALIIAYARKRYKDELDYTKLRISNDAAMAAKHRLLGEAVDPDQPLWGVTIGVSKPKTSSIMEMTQDNTFPISARAFLIYAKDRIVELEPLRVPSFAQH